MSLTGTPYKADNPTDKGREAYFCQELELFHILKPMLACFSVRRCPLTHFKKF